ncbi:hypothetical protein FB45DRAFT_956751 [Roridomyces roridus]|uniref:Uncharacterized protein n=1 Tax=Roridomyces roridus TaxID=1738132 RepID=A0AAD7F945_9AGAR|nr:hypothetical protein FB45DRAFT_956751 [Roridomyces roridus]
MRWSQITQYRGFYASATQLDVLRSCRNLVECSIRFDGGESSEASVVLPALRRLQVQGTAVLSYLTAPNLHDLLVHDAGPSVSAFLLRSACQLRELVVTQSLFHRSAISSHSSTSARSSNIWLSTSRDRPCTMRTCLPCSMLFICRVREINLTSVRRSRPSHSDGRRRTRPCSRIRGTTRSFE